MAMNFKTLHKRDFLTHSERSALRQERFLTNQMYRYYGKTSKNIRLPWKLTEYRSRVYKDRKILRSFLCNRTCRDYLTEPFISISQRFASRINAERNFLASPDGDYLNDREARRNQKKATNPRFKRGSLSAVV